VIWRFFSGQTAREGDEPAGPLTLGPFRTPRRVEIRGYDGHAMEPAISPDEEVLVFNDASDRGPDKNRSGPAASRRTSSSSRVPLPT
jgi:hypothetical protein